MSLMASCGKVDITLALPTTHDKLYAKLLLFKQDDKSVLFVSMDYICLGGGEIGHISEDFYSNLKDILHKKGINDVLCGTTHTHTDTDMVVSEDKILPLIAKEVDRLLDTLEPVTVGNTKTSDNRFLINRTLKLKDGTQWTVRQAHPAPPDDMYDSLTEADDSITVIRIDKADKTPMCIMFNFGCHPLVGYADNGPTANYPGIAEEFIREQMNTEAMLFQSTGGDVTEIDYKDYFRPKDCSTYGLLLGQTVVRAAKKIETTDADLSSLTVKADFPLRKDIPENLEKIKQEMQRLWLNMSGCPLSFKNFLPLYTKYLISPDYPLDYKYRYLKDEELGLTQYKDQDVINRNIIKRYLENIQAMEKLSKLASCYKILTWHQSRVEKNQKGFVTLDVTGIKLGDMTIISAPVEPLTDVGKRLYEQCKDKKVFFAAYSNGYMHYGAAEDKYQSGAYETCECDLDKGWLSVYLDTVKNIVDKL